MRLRKKKGMKQISDVIPANKPRASWVRTARTLVLLSGRQKGFRGREITVSVTGRTELKVDTHRH